MTSNVIVIERATDTFAAYAPDLPACVATGKTIEEVTVNMNVAIDMHIEGLKEDGEDVPEPQAEAVRIKVVVQ